MDNVFLAPAKINWFLYVTGMRPDGYRDIVSFMSAVTLYDTLLFEPSAGIDVFTSGMDHIPVESNLVYKAARALQQAGGSDKGVHVVLKKSIPVEAGLGGGSSDAARTLAGLNDWWGLKLDRDTLLALAAGIGSDVPFFIEGTSAFVEGRGERLTSLPLCRTYHLLIVKPVLSISTAWAYARVTQYRDEYRSLAARAALRDEILYCLQEGDWEALAGLMDNDIEKAIEKELPLIPDMKRELLEAGARVAMLSGSGSALFGLFCNRQEAQEARDVILSKHPQWSAWAVETLP